MKEATVMTVWPTIAYFPEGRLLGRLYENDIGFGNIFTLGKLIAVLSIPIALALFFRGLSPFTCRRYRITNRRLLILKGLSGVEDRFVSLDDFDAIDVVTRPGYAWYYAGDMIFRKGNVETFRLHAVPRPESFKHVCLKTQRAHSSVKKVREREATPA
jgi:hypothetical protein